MNIQHRFLLIFLPLLMIACQQGDSSSEESLSSAAEATEEVRIISLSGFLTEVLHEMGHGDQIVGRDVTSTYPESVAQNAPSLGHVSQLNLEALLQLKPNYLFYESDQKQQFAALEQLEKAGVKLIEVPTSFFFNNSLQAAKAISEHLPDKTNQLQQMANRIKADSTALAEKVGQIASEEAPKVLFIYARGAGRLMVSGTGTAAAAIIEKSGGQNAISSFENYRALTPEALVEASPDVILMFTSGLASLDGREGLGQITGIPQTEAYKNNRIKAMDGHYLTAFGPRVVSAATELADFLYQAE
ncbi:MAG: ABC transporter substrate-binding protein [Bacteroidota bacterium]